MSALLYRIGHFAGRHPWRILAAWVLAALSIGGQADSPMGRVRVAEDRASFVVGPSGARFVPRGFNYDRDERGRLFPRGRWDGYRGRDRPG